MVSQRDASGGGTVVMDVAPPSWRHLEAKAFRVGI